MTDNVIISIKGKQLYGESGPDEMELVTDGTLHWDAQGGCTVSYQESELTGLEGTTTRLHIDGRRVTLLREGSINSQMVFEEGRRHLSMYETPYGELSIGVSTRRMRSTLDEAGGDLEIDYAIEIDNLVAGQNLFRMNVKKKEKRGAVVSSADGAERGQKPKRGRRPGWVLPEAERSRASQTGEA